MRRKLKEVLYCNALNASKKHIKIINLEKGMKTNVCWNDFNSDVQKLIYYFFELSMYLHCSSCDLLYISFGIIIVDENSTKY